MWIGEIDLAITSCNSVYLPCFNVSSLTHAFWVGPISLNVPEHVIMVLQESFHPEEDDGNQGINIYFQVRQFLVLYFGSTI